MKKKLIALFISMAVMVSIIAPAASAATSNAGAIEVNITQHDAQQIKGKFCFPATINVSVTENRKLTTAEIKTVEGRIARGEIRLSGNWRDKSYRMPYGAGCCVYFKNFWGSIISRGYTNAAGKVTFKAATGLYRFHADTRLSSCERWTAVGWGSTDVWIGSGEGWYPPFDFSISSPRINF